MDQYFQHNKWKVLSICWLVLTGVLIWYYIIPEFNRTAQLYSDLKSQNLKISSARNWAARLEGYNKQQKQLESYLSSIFVRLPEHDQMSTIVDELFSKAKGRNVKLISMRPTERTIHDTYEELPITIRIQGLFHEIARYVSSVEQSKYLMKVDHINIQSKETINSPLNAQLSINVIILKKNPNGGDTDA